MFNEERIVNERKTFISINIFEVRCGSQLRPSVTKCCSFEECDLAL